MADTTKTLPPLPQPYATSVTWHGHEGSTWQQWHDATDPMPTEWDDEAPDEVVHVYTADQMRAYAAAALAAQAQPTEASGPDYGPAWLGAAAARVQAQPDVAARHLREYAAMQGAQAQAEPYGWAVTGGRLLFFGEWAEHEAKDCARIVGGTAEAFPLYRNAQAQGEPVVPMSPKDPFALAEGWRVKDGATGRRLKITDARNGWITVSIPLEGAQAQADRCTSCNGTGDLIDTTGEWRGYCVCPDGVALKAQPTNEGGPDYGPAWLGAAAARVLAQPEVAARHLREYAAMLAAQAQGESVAHVYAGDCPDENQPHARDPECPACRAMIAPQPAAQRVADELRIARGAIRELEAKVFSQEQALAVLRASVDSYHRDMADPPGYLQDAVIRAAGLGAMAEQIAALKAALKAAQPVAVPDGRLAALAALEAAVAALYFDDSSKFRSALGSVILHLDQQLAGEVLCHPKAAYDRVHAMLAAAQKGGA